MKRLLQLAIVIVLLGVVAHAQAPVLFFTDITSGPKTGGENNKGVYVTIYGNYFGASPSVTVGGGAVDNCKAVQTWLWYQRVSCQLGANAATGNVQVTTASGSSNTLSFTVRAGNIYFIAPSPTGNDGAAGTFAAPWATLDHARTIMVGGDTVYFRAGTYGAGGEYFYKGPSQSWGGDPSNTMPMAILGYPNETATIRGQIVNYVSANGEIAGSSNLWFGGLKFDGQSSHTAGIMWRGIGNGGQTGANRVHNIYISGVEVVGWSSTGCGGTAVFEAGGDGPLDDVHLRGVHVNGMASNDRLDHGIYHSAGGDNFEVGWSSVHDMVPGSNSGCGSSSPGWGIQLYHGTSANYPDTNNPSIHDTLVYNTPYRGGMNVADYTFNFMFYNNVVYNAGTSTAEEGYGIRLTSDAHPAGLPYGVIANNVFYHCGRNSTESAQVSFVYSGAVTYRNNIVWSSAGTEPYQYFTTAGVVTADHNLWFGNGGKPSWDNGATTLNVTPGLVNAAGGDFHIANTSSAVYNAGYDMSATLTRDKDGISRPQTTTFDIGPYEYNGAPAATRTLGGGRHLGGGRKLQ